MIDPNAEVSNLTDEKYDEIVKILIDVFANHNEFVDGKAVSKTTGSQIDNTTHLEYFNQMMQEITKQTRKDLEKLNLNEHDINWLVKSAIRFCKLREIVDSGSVSLADSPAWQFTVYLEPPGGDAVLPNGFSKILNPLMRRLPPECIKFLANVKKIFWSNKHHTNSINNRAMNSKVEIQYETKESLETIFADHVILTLPIGCLKKCHSNMFQPSLPPEKVLAIEK